MAEARSALALATLLVLSHCGGASTGRADAPADGGVDATTPDAGVDAPQVDAPADGQQPVTGYPAVHASPPQVQTSGGPVLAAPHVVPVFFPNDPLRSGIESFLAALAGSEGASYWAATTHEYGVGTPSIAPSIVVTDPPPASITDTQIATWLAGYVGGEHAGWPAIDANNVYVVFYPLATVITRDGDTLESCRDFSGYHAETPVAAAGGSDAGATDAGGPDAGDAGGPTFVHAVLARCSNWLGLTGLDAVTGPASHEIVEAATDPELRTNPAYDSIDVDHYVWGDALGTEVGDMCHMESPDRLYQHMNGADGGNDGGSFVVQRTWSDQAAEADGDPCVPAIPTVPYFNAAPDLSGRVELYPDPVTHPTSFLRTTGVRVPVGQSVTIAVRLFATSPRPTWYVQFYELTATGAPNTLQATWDKPTATGNTSGNNGDVRHLTITAMAPGPLGGAEFALYSSDTDDVNAPTYTSWFGFVAN
jgi:hypothetical protein